jgi:DNA (cytosine-5)-methyltransferase 1
MATIRQQGVLNARRNFRVVSLFAGCGGMDLGFRGGFQVLGRRYKRLPMEIVWANEIDSAACETYRMNLGDHIVEGDIWSVIDDLPKAVDVVIGGFPCQDISVNGKGAGINGSRSGLYRAMVEVIGLLKPKIFVAENVKGLMSRKHTGSRAKVIDDFESLGYTVGLHQVLATDYGVPQTRERVFIIGTTDNLPLFVAPQPLMIPKKKLDARFAIGDLARIAESPAFAHVWSRARRSPEQGNRRLKADRPGYTIRAECHGNIQWHYTLPRRISMREAARIQSFPDSFTFSSGLRETERQIGNAVPPVLAWHFAREVSHYLDAV